MAANINNLPFIDLVAKGPRVEVQEPRAIKYANKFTRKLIHPVTHARIAICKTLDLSGQAWLKSVMQILEPPVVTLILPTLVKLRLSDILITLLPGDALATLHYVADFFHRAPNLQSVNLSHNSIGTRGLEELRELLANVSITEWFLVQTDLVEADGLTLLQAFAPNNSAVVRAANSAFLRHGSVQAAADAAVAVIEANVVHASYRRLTTLHTSKNQMGVSGAKLLGALLSVSIHLVSFAHAGSSPKREGTVFLCMGLRAMARNACLVHRDEDNRGTTVLQHLDVSNFTLNDTEHDGHKCVDDLRFVLLHSPQLQVLKLADSGLTVAELGKVLEALERTGARLTTLDLGGLDMGSEGAARLIKSIANPKTEWTLQHLAIGSNELGDHGVAAIVKALSAASSTTPVTANLISLDVSDNNVGTDGAQAFLDNRLPSLQTLKMNGNDGIPQSLVADLVRLYTKVLIYGQGGNDNESETDMDPDDDTTADDEDDDVDDDGDEDDMADDEDDMADEEEDEDA